MRDSYLQMGTPAAGLSDPERAHLQRLRDFYGNSLADSFLVEYSLAPVGQRSLAMASQRVLARGQIDDGASISAFLRTRFSSALDETEIVFDE
jgi:hypothetical protein